MNAGFRAVGRTIAAIGVFLYLTLFFARGMAGDVSAIYMGIPLVVIGLVRVYQDAQKDSE